MTSFTPLTSLIGGALIGVAAVLLMALHGRIAGVTGILAGVLPPGPEQDWTWRLAFLLGMLASPLVYRFAVGQWVGIDVPVSAGMRLLSCAIVGVGVTYGSGYTSGHGVCGLARLSGRSIVATLTFMATTATTAATVFIIRHLIGG